MRGHTQNRCAARIVASVAAAVLIAAEASCYTGGARPTSGANTTSREVLPIAGDATRYDNLYDAIAHIRPEYLRVREEGLQHLEPVAYLNGVRLADPTMLRLVPVSTVIDVRWVRPNQTSALYEFRSHLNGGIFVRTN